MMTKIFACLIMLLMATSCHEKSKQVAERTIKVDTTFALKKVKPKHKKPVKGTTPTYNRSIYQQYITPQIANLLMQHLPDWRLPDPSAWDKIWFHEYKIDTSLVNYASADFNGDQQPEYAFILQNAKKGFAAWVLQSDGDVYRPIRLTQTYKAVKSIEMGLAVTPPGKIHYINNISGKTETKLLQHPAITTLWFETSSETFYWENGRYASATTCD